MFPADIEEFTSRAGLLKTSPGVRNVIMLARKQIGWFILVTVQHL